MSSGNGGTVRGDFDTLAPEFEVKLNGTKLTNEQHADVIGLTVLEDVDAVSTFTLSIAAWDMAQMKPKWIDDDLFSEGSQVELSLGFRDRTEPLLSGEITVVEPVFQLRQAPTLTVRGHDCRHRLMRSRRTRTFTNSKDSDIVSRIAAEAGLGADVHDSGPSLPYVMQHNQTDLEFLSMRAQRIGFELSARERTLRFGPRSTDREPVTTLHREVELLEFRPRVNTLDQLSGVEVHGWSPTDKREIIGRASAGDESKLMQGSKSGPAAVRTAFEPEVSVRVREPVHNQEEADQLARRTFVEMAMRHIRAEGMCAGDPKLRAGAVVAVEGIGKRFSGHYYLTSVEHRFGRSKGYRTSFSARRNST